MRRSFLWQGNKGNKGYNLVKRDALTLNMKQEGLGIKELNLHNNCLLQKWLWKFGIEDMTLWKRLIIEKYGFLKQWTIEEVKGTFGCSVWKTIRRLAQVQYLHIL